MKKIPYSIEKKKWSPSLIPGGIVLISTLNKDGTPHFSPKSWIQMVSFEPSILIFSGSNSNLTEENILLSHEFVVNIVDETIINEVFDSIKWKESERIKNSSFTFGSSCKLKTPIINECKAHLECKLIETKQIGSGFLLFGEILFATIWDKIKYENDVMKKYQLLKQTVFQENKIYSVLNSVQKLKK